MNNSGVSVEGGNYWNVSQNSLSINCRDLSVPFNNVMGERGSWGKGRSSTRRMGQCMNRYSEEDLLQPMAFKESNVGDQQREARNHFNRAIRHVVNVFKSQIMQGTQKDPILGELINYILWIFPMIRATAENRKAIAKRLGSFISNRIGHWKRNQKNYQKGPCKKKGEKRRRRDAPAPPTAIEEDILIDDPDIACGDTVKLKDPYSDRIVGEGVLLLPMAVHPDFEEWEANRYAFICLRKKTLRDDVTMPWSGDQPWDECRVGCNIMWERLSILPSTQQAARRGEVRETQNGGALEEGERELGSHDEEEGELGRHEEEMELRSHEEEDLESEEGEGEVGRHEEDEKEELEGNKGEELGSHKEDEEDEKEELEGKKGEELGSHEEDEEEEEEEEEKEEEKEEEEKEELEELEGNKGEELGSHEEVEEDEKEELEGSDHLNGEVREALHLVVNDIGDKVENHDGNEEEEGHKGGVQSKGRRFSSGGGWFYEEIDYEEEEEKQPKEMGKGKRCRKTKTFIDL